MIEDENLAPVDTESLKLIRKEADGSQLMMLNAAAQRQVRSMIDELMKHRKIAPHIDTAMALVEHGAFEKVACWLEKHDHPAVAKALREAVIAANEASG